MPISTSSAEARDELIAGRNLLNNLRNSEAVRQFESAIRKDKEFALAYYYLSVSSATARSFFENLRLAQKYAPKASKGEQLLIKSAEAAISGDIMGQRDILGELVALYPADNNVRMFLANHFFQRQFYDSAAAEYRAIVAANPEFAPPYNMLGYTYRAIGQLDQASKAFSRYIELIPDDPNPYDSYAELLMRQGKFTEAIEHYRRALDLVPSFGPSRLGIANSLLFMEKYDEAREELRISYDNAVDGGQRRGAIFATAVTYVDEGLLDLATETLWRQYQFDSTGDDPGEMSGVLQNIAFLQLWQGEVDAAIPILELSVKLVLDSDMFDRVKENVQLDDELDQARIRLARGQYAEARRLAQLYLTKVDSAQDAFRSQTAHMVLGRIAIAAGDYQVALDHLDLANDQLAWTDYHRALAYEGLGDKQRALELYRKVAVAYERISLTYALVRQRAVQKVVELEAGLSS